MTPNTIRPGDFTRAIIGHVVHYGPVTDREMYTLMVKWGFKTTYPSVRSSLWSLARRGVIYRTPDGAYKQYDLDD